MAISAEQAQQLAHVYQSGDTGGLQSLVNQFGVTQSDVQQYFPGFDLQSAGINLPTTSTINLQSLMGGNVPTSLPLYTGTPAQERAAAEANQRAGITTLGSMPAPTDYGSLVSKAYQDILGRAADTGGAEFYTQKLRSGELTADKLRDALAYGAQGLEDRLKAQKAIGKDIFAPEDYLRGTSGFGYTDVMNYINANLQDPVKIAQAAKQYGIDPNEIMQAYRATGTQAPEMKQIEEYLAKGQTGFQPRFQEMVTSALGTTEDQAALEKALKLAPGDLAKTALDPTRFAGMSIENIEKSLQESDVNRRQEALRAANIMQNIYGQDAKTAYETANKLYSGKEVDAKTKELYDRLLKTGATKDVETQILQDAAVRSPQSQFFKDNPNALAIYSPVGEVKSNPEGSGQYGIDPVTKLPFMHRGETDKMLGNEVVRGNDQEFRNTIGQDKTGFDPHSAWAGRVAKGVGVFGVNANQQQVNDFDRIENDVNKYGGVKIEPNPEGGTYEVVYKPVKDPETGNEFIQAVPFLSLFGKPGDESGQQALDRYNLYRQTQGRMQEAAKSLGIDTSKYQTTKQAYDDLNTKLKDTYLWQGRTDVLDPAAAKTLGIEDVKDSKKHATVLYKAVGDKLVPQKVLKTFDFQDPNTSRGFFGDLIGGIAEIMSIPPIAIAFSMAGGLPGLLSGNLGVGAGAGVASEAFKEAMAGSLFNPGNLGASLAESLGLSLSPEQANLLGRVALNAGTSGLMTGAATGDLDKAGLAALAGATGTGVAGLSEPYLGKALSQVVGGAASKAVTGSDLSDYIKNQLFGTGISTLMGATKGATGISDESANLLKAFAPIIMSGKVSPDDLVRLSQAVNQSQPARV